MQNYTNNPPVVDTTLQAAISIKVPPFWTHDPPLWLCHIVAQFASSHITSDAACLTHIIGSLSPEILNEVRNLIMALLGTVSYNTFKTTLLTRTEESQQKRLHQLLLTEELGDKKPSQLLRQMKQLVGDDNLPNRVLKQLFVQHLPSNTQEVLAATEDNKSVEELAELADRIARCPEQLFVPVSSCNSSSTNQSSPAFHQRNRSGRTTSFNNRAGIRSTVKEGVGHTPAELVYSTELALPGQMIDPILPQELPDLTNYIHRLWTSMSQFSPAAPRQQNTTTHVLKDINSWTHVFIRNDGISAQLWPPYSGPYKVLDRQPKYFVLEMAGKRNTVSVDRLKKAFIEQELPPTPATLSTDSTTVTLQISKKPSAIKQQQTISG
uniref:DUF7041 domain-containing protein n=1 Tax=Octopus bimaculoides TaxID=37653 RepID=A0A0L8HF87_OCTBM